MLLGKKNDTAKTVAQRYYSFLYRFLGVPVPSLSDNAGPFISEFLKTLNKLTAMKHHYDNSLHPQTHETIEILNA
jgi:hypothetical protein